LLSHERVTSAHNGVTSAVPKLAIHMGADQLAEEVPIWYAPRC